MGNGEKDVEIEIPNTKIKNRETAKTAKMGIGKKDVEIYISNTKTPTKTTEKTHRLAFNVRQRSHVHFLRFNFFHRVSNLVWTIF